MMKKTVKYMIKKLEVKAEGHECEEEINELIDEANELVDDDKPIEAMKVLNNIGNVQGVDSDDFN